MEVRRRVVVEEHADKNAEEMADSWHFRPPSLSAQLLTISIQSDCYYPLLDHPALAAFQEGGK
jgi:hypothetical protein